jgi:hypothetical protein
MQVFFQKLFRYLPPFPFLLTGCVATLIALGPVPVSAIKLEPLSAGRNQSLFQVTCDNGEQHTVIANPAEHDFQYYYPNKKYYIKYYDLDFLDRKDFAAWICRNK